MENEATTCRFFLWALPEGLADRLHERPLTSFPLTKEEADKVTAAARRDGWHGFRLVAEDNLPPDFAATVRPVAR